MHDQQVGEPDDALGQAPRLTVQKQAIKNHLRETRNMLPASLETAGQLQEQYPLGDLPTTVTILGERGSGKTTLLYSVCRDLIEEGVDLVLPPMQPELFSPNESVISAFLAGLWTMYVAADGGEEDGDLGRMLTACARSFAASRTTEAALAHASDSTIDFAEDAVAISRSGAKLPLQLRELARRLCMDDKAGPRLMVVPVDDPDMSPLAVKAILRDLRILGSIPGVVPIAAFCEVDLIRDWMREREVRTTEELAVASESYERQTEKLFPYRSRFPIPAFGVRGRIDFAPLGKSETLKEKLSALRRALEVRGHHWPIDDILGEVDVRYGIPNPLPGNARLLVQVWDTLDQIDPNAGEVSEELLRRVVSSLFDLLTKPLLNSLGKSAGQKFYELENAPARDGSNKPNVYVHLSDAKLYLNPESTLYGADEFQETSSIELRKIGNVGALKPGDTTSAESRMATHSQSAAAALLVFGELAYGSGLFNVHNNSRIEHKDWITLQEVSLAGLATDDWFLTLSDAYTLSEALQVADDWDRMAGLADKGASPRVLLTEALRASFAATGAAEGLDAESSYEEIFARATSYYAEHWDRSDRISKRFCAWYEFELPMQWHSAFFGNSTLRMCCSEYRRVAEKAFERGVRDLYLSPRSYFDSRFSQILDVITDDNDKREHCWLAGYFELASAVESTKLEEMVELSPFWQQRITAQSAGAHLAGKAFSHAKGKHSLAPYSTPEGSDLFIRARGKLRKRYASALHNASRSGRR